MGRAEDGSLRIRVTAPAIEGRANAAVVVLVARWLGVARSRVRVMRGAAGRRKWIEVAGVEPLALERLVNAALAARKEGAG